MTPPKNEVLENYLTQKEIKEFKEKKSDRYKELSERLSRLWNKTQVELAKLRQELDNLSLDEKVNKLFDLVEKAEKNQKPSKEEEKAKKEAEEKWFSWEKISKLVEEKWGWFSWAWITAGVSAFFSNFLGNLFNSAKDWVSELIGDAKKLANWETSWTWEWNNYISEKWKLELEKTDEWFIEEIKINWEKYKIENESPAEIKIIDWKKYLVIWDRKVVLNHLWKIFDEIKNNPNEINFSTDKSIVETIWWYLTPDFINEVKSFFTWNWEFKLIKEDYFWKIKENIINNWNTKIEFIDKIEWKKFPINNIKIKEININWKKFMIEPKNQEFKLQKDWDKYLLSVDFLWKAVEFDDFKIDIRDIERQINNKNKPENIDNKYYLFEPALLNIDITKPNIFLLKEI